jgi:hypothetical protein
MPNSVTRAVRGLAKVSVDEIERELARRRTVASQLEAKRTRLLGKLAELELEIRGHGGGDVAVPDGGRGRNWGRARGGRATTLTHALVSVLKGKAMSVTEMAEAVKKAGYKTTSANFRTIVNAAVTREGKLFRRVGHGVYTAR